MTGVGQQGGIVRPGGGFGRCAISAAGVAAFALAAVTFQVLDRGPLLVEDGRFRVSLLHHHVAWVGDLASVVSAVAAVPVSMVLLLAVGGVSGWRTKAWGPLVVATLAIGLFGVTVGTAKVVVGRARPPNAPTDLFAAGSSFPSGHTTAIVVLVGCLWLLAGPRLNARGRGWLATLGVLMALLVGLSRVYLDQHWLTDILASWALGGLIVSVVAALPSLGGPLRAIWSTRTDHAHDRASILRSSGDERVPTT